jgi:hypothetical protein
MVRRGKHEAVAQGLSLELRRAMPTVRGLPVK